MAITWRDGVIGIKIKKSQKRKSWEKTLFDVVYSRQVNVLVVAFVVISVFIFACDAAEVIPTRFVDISNYIEGFITSFFVIEYLLKLFLSKSKGTYIKRHFIEFLAIFPILRIFRVLRIVKLLRDFGFTTFSTTVRRKTQILSSGLSERALEFALVSFLLTAIVIFGAIGILHFERGMNEQFKSFSDGLWWTVVTLTTVGYGDKFPLTLEGKALAIVLMLLGLSFFALITSFVSSFIIEKYRKEEYRGMDLVGLKNHTIVCGWNNNSSTIINELIQLFSSDLKHVVVIAEQVPEFKFDERVKFLKGDFTKADILETAQIKEASAAIIVSDQVEGRSGQDKDARTILAALSVNKLNPNVYVCVELNNKENMDHAINASVDELIVASDYTGNLLAHAVKNHGITSVFNELLTSSDGSQFFRTKCPSSYQNKSFDEALKEIRMDFRCILLGIFREGKYQINPVVENLLETDELVYVGQQEIQA